MTIEFDAQSPPPAALSFRIPLLPLPIHGLHFPVLALEFSLHFELGLAFTFDPLLFHVADYTGVHCLCLSSQSICAQMIEAMKGFGGMERDEAYRFLILLSIMHEEDGADGEKGCTG